jgi:hypothetical protein
MPEPEAQYGDDGELEGYGWDAAGRQRPRFRPDG